MTPRTEAGRAAADRLTHDIGCSRVECDCTVAEHIAAIEAEARKQERDTVEKEVLAAVERGYRLALDEAIAAVLQDVTHERIAARMGAVGAPWLVHEGVKHSVDAVIDALTRLRDGPDVR